MDFVPVYIAQSVLYWVFIVIENLDTLMKDNESRNNTSKSWIFLSNSFWCFRSSCSENMYTIILKQSVQNDNINKTLG